MRWRKARTRGGGGSNTSGGGRAAGEGAASEGGHLGGKGAAKEGAAEEGVAQALGRAPAAGGLHRQHAPHEALGRRRHGVLGRAGRGGGGGARGGGGGARGVHVAPNGLGEGQGEAVPHVLGAPASRRVVVPCAHPLLTPPAPPPRPVFEERPSARPGRRAPPCPERGQQHRGRTRAPRQGCVEKGARCGFACACAGRERIKTALCVPNKAGSNGQIAET